MKVKFKKEVVKQFKKKQKLTNNMIAEALGLKIDTVKQMFRTGIITEYNLEKLGKLINVDPEYLKGSRLQKPESDFQKEVFEQLDRIDSEGNIIFSYGGSAKKRLDVFRDYMILLGERGIEDMDTGSMYNWGRKEVVEKCDASFEFRFSQYILKFLQDEKFISPKEANLLTETKISSKTLVKLAESLDCEVDDLFIEE